VLSAEGDDVISFTVDGARKVAQRFAAAAVASTRKLDSLDKAALLVTRSAKIKAPVDTGFLKSAIQPERPSYWEADVVSHAEYSIYQEVGTSKMKAHPFMRPALDENREQIQKLIGNEVVANVAGALGGGASVSTSALGASVGMTGGRDE
jgi:HK97 gp10 family phage protein